MRALEGALFSSRYSEQNPSLYCNKAHLLSLLSLSVSLLLGWMVHMGNNLMLQWHAPVCPLLSRPRFCTTMGLQRKRKPTSSLSYKQIFTNT